MSTDGAADKDVQDVHPDEDMDSVSEENSGMFDDDSSDSFDVTDAVMTQLQTLLDASISSAEEQRRVIERFLLMMQMQRSLSDEERRVLETPLPAPLSTPDIAGVAKYIAEGHAKNIIVMCGAGISVSAGIPDFRSPGTGLYYNLQKYMKEDVVDRMEDPQDVFSLAYFRKNPKPFYEVAKAIYPDLYHPTKAHYFVLLLHEHGLLLRDFTQNIDTLELIAGIPREKLVFSHGSFAKSHCVGCGKEYSYEYVRDKVFADEIPKCECGACIKPDIVFFGEALPAEFFAKRVEDFPKCDLLIVMGTSLKVQPFASLISHVAPEVPRLLINMEVVDAKPAPPPADAPEYERYQYRTSSRFAFNDPENRRDALYKGYCDDGVQALCDALGWGEELKKAFEAPVKAREVSF